jgi:hypothetical protein
VPPLPAVLDPGPRAHRCLIVGPRARRRLDPASLGVRRCHPLPQAIDLGPASIGARRRRSLPQAIDVDRTPSECVVDLDPTPSAFGEGDTLPPSLITTVM